MATKTMLKYQSLLFKGSLICCRKAMFSSGSTSYYDIIIAGGGLVGTSLACALAKSSRLCEKKILLLEGGPENTMISTKKDDPYSNRVVSINPKTRRFLETIGAWKYISDCRYKTVKKMQIWDANSNGLITFENPGLVDDISYIVENNVILFALEQVVKDTRVTVRHCSKVKSIQLPIENESTTLELENDGEKFSCDLLVGAEGYNSATRKAMNVQYLSWNYHQSGVVATLKLSDPTENVVAWQRFLPDGPIALLPLTNDMSSLVWTTTSKAASNLVKMSEEDFVDAVNDAIWRRDKIDGVVETASRGLSRALESLSLPTGLDQQLPPSVQCVIPGSRASFPLGFGHSTNYVARGAALVGDAAHRVHPLAGQGVNLGFGDVECLEKVLSKAVFSGSKLSNTLYLQDYESSRQLHNLPVMMAIDGLQKLYNTTATPIVLLRSLGMQMTHSLSPVKKLIMQYASA